MDLCSREGSAAAVAEEKGVSRPSLYAWKNELLGKEMPPVMDPKEATLQLRIETNCNARLSAAQEHPQVTVGTRHLEEGERTPKKRGGHQSAGTDEPGKDAAD